MSNFTTGQIKQVMQDPKLRAQDCPQLMMIANHLLINPNDDYLQECFIQMVRGRAEIVGQAGPLYLNCPPKGAILTEGPAVGVGILQTGDTFPFPCNRASAGTIVTGLPGSCKTTLAMIILIQLILSGVQAIVWDIKATWRKLLSFPPLAERVIVFSIHDIIVALLQPPPGTGQHEWTNRFVKVFAQAYARISAQRILRQVIDELLAFCPPGCWPTPKMMIERLKKLQLKNFREKEYISSILWTLIDLDNHFPNSFEFTSSNFLENLYDMPGKLIIIEDEGLPVQHWNFLISLFNEWILTYRKNNHQSRNFDIVHVAEDSSSLLDAANDRSTPGGVSLMAQNLNLCREMRIGNFLICHSLKEVSPKILANIESYFLCSLRGDDPRLAQQLLGISREQTEFMRTNPRGTACSLVPAIWPLPVLINYPRLPEM
ncbi:MAG: hypothetical protein K9M75_05575 [Phycisphaerae bacterium]|nr:hypothetical protein [Phycisphaerae bacterium]